VDIYNIFGYKKDSHQPADVSGKHTEHPILYNIFLSIPINIIVQLTLVFLSVKVCYKDEF